MEFKRSIKIKLATLPLTENYSQQVLKPFKFMKHIKLLLTGLFLVVAVLSNAQGQNQGILSGTVLDETVGEPLIGANVYTEDAVLGTSTDIDGKYQFKLDAGTYTVIISYTGYQEKRITGVEIKAGEITYLDASLNDQVLDMELEVEVTAKAIERSENALLLLQKKSEKIQDGISSQEMSRFAVSDAAAAMKRVTGATVQGGKFVYIRGLGDRYSLTQLNGMVVPSTDPYRNSVPLDPIPAPLLDNITPYKTFPYFRRPGL